MAKPKISVVIPVYNAEKFLKKCLDSVINQPMREIEIICVNDGSTDNSALILEEYANKDDRISVVHQPNSKAGAARNNGLERACGEFVHFVDADDFLADDIYHNLYDIADKNKLEWLLFKGKPVDLETEQFVGGALAEYLSQSHMIKSDYEKPFSFKDGVDRLTAHPMYPPWANLYCREFLIKNNLKFDTLQQFDDHYFYFAAAARAKRILVADVCAVYHRTNNPNSSTGGHLKHFAKHFISFKNIFDDCKFLDRKLYAAVLRAELNSIFYCYNEIKEQNMNFEAAHKQICEFVRDFDQHLIKEVSKGAWWALDFVMILLEEINKSENLTKHERARRIKACLKLPRPSVPIDTVPFGSRVALASARSVGRNVHDILTRFNNCKAELNDIFYRYNEIKEQNINFQAAHKQMCEFVRAFDQRLVKDVSKGAWWALDFTMILLEALSKDENLTKNEKARRIKACLKLPCLPVPVDKVPFGSRVALAGASSVGRNVHYILTRFIGCEVVTWVEWEDAQDEWSKNNPLITAPNNITDNEFDYIFLAMTEPEIATGVSAWLTGGKGVCAKKIISVVSDLV